MALFKVLLTGSAALWLDGLPAASTNNWANMKPAFETRYNPPGFMKYQYANDLFNTKQGDSSVDDFCVEMQRLGREVNASEEMLHFAVNSGLKPDIRNHVTRTQPTTWKKLVQHARIGEMCLGPDGAGFPDTRVHRISAYPKTLAHRAMARVTVRHRIMAKCRITARHRTTDRTLHHSRCP